MVGLMDRAWTVEASAYADLSHMRCSSQDNRGQLRTQRLGFKIQIMLWPVSIPSQGSMSSWVSLVRVDIVMA